jgi:uncharacterized protein (DUF305 family)
MHFFMKDQRRFLATIAAFAAAACATAYAASSSAPSTEGPFLAENRTAMDRMMADMAVKPSGDADQDFVAMMIPHHQGAIDMAKAELRYGRNEQLRRIAQEIVVDQQQEIGAMHLALGQPAPVAQAAPTQPPGAAKPMAMPMMNMRKEP